MSQLFQWFYAVSYQFPRFKKNAQRTHGPMDRLTDGRTYRPTDEESLLQRRGNVLTSADTDYKMRLASFERMILVDFGVFSLMLTDGPRTDGWTDGQTLILRCEDASKEKSGRFNYIPSARTDACKSWRIVCLLGLVSCEDALFKDTKLKITQKSRPFWGSIWEDDYI